MNVNLGQYGESDDLGRPFQDERRYPVSVGRIPHTSMEVKTYRRSNSLYFSKLQAQKAAQQIVKLAPIRLNIEYNGMKINDQFTWNVNETVISPENFGRLLIEDLGEPCAVQLIPIIADEIRRQVEHCSSISEEDFCGNEQTQDESDSEEKFNKEGCTVIKLDVNIGSLYLRDQFEWPLFSHSHVTPEDFALQLTAELGAGTEFTSVIAHSIREQLCFARINLGTSTPSVNVIRGRTFRVENVEVWQPELKDLSGEDLDKIYREKERRSRLLRRQIRHLGRNLPRKRRSSSVHGLRGRHK